MQYEPDNKMTPYNVAITVCPVIFRPRVQQADEILGVGIFYDAFIRMIDNYHFLFEADDKFCNQVNPVPRPVVNKANYAESGTVGTKKIADLKGLLE